MKLSFFIADVEYCEFLRSADYRVPYTFDEKRQRPFIGVLIDVNSCKYYAPLSSPKPKHLNMKNQLDFLKINDGIWGAINFNNMIPIKNANFIKIDIKVKETDTKSQVDYKNLLQNQLSWCNSNRKTVSNKAAVLHKLISEKRAGETLLKRCCDFKLLEEKACEYAKSHNEVNVEKLPCDKNKALTHEMFVLKKQESNYSNKPLTK